MPNYYPAVQTAIPLRIYTDAGAPYTSGTAPTLLVRKNRTGAAATATGTLTHAGNGIWDYTPAVGEVSAPCTFLMLIWSGTGIAHGHEAIEFEADYTATVAGRIDATVSSRSTLAAADIRSAVGLASANLDTQLTTIDDFLDTEVAAILAAVDTVAAIKAKTDNLPASPAAVGSAMTLAADAVNATSLAASAVAEIASAGSVVIQLVQGPYELSIEGAGPDGALEVRRGDILTIRAALKALSGQAINLTGATLTAKIMGLDDSNLVTGLAVTALQADEGTVSVVLNTTSGALANIRRAWLVITRTVGSSDITSYPAQLLFQ
jgi:hypothetical protein